MADGNRNTTSGKPTSGYPLPNVELGKLYTREQAELRTTTKFYQTPTAVDQSNIPVEQQLSCLQRARALALSAGKSGHALPLFAREFFPPSVAAPQSTSTTTNTTAKPVRQFVVASYNSFYAHYRRLLPRLRTYHELLYKDDPCHLYYDLDIDYEQCDTDFLDRLPPGFHTYVAFKKHLCNCLCDLFPLLDRSTIAFHDCESTTEKKFSVHGVVRGPPAFANSEQVGIFMHTVRERARSQSLMACHYKSKTGKWEFIADLAVYNKNHSLRLPGATKPVQGDGKPRYLIDLSSDQYSNDDGTADDFDLLAENRCQQKLTGKFQLPPLQRYLLGLVQYILPATTVVSFDALPPSEPRLLATAVEITNRAALLRSLEALETFLNTSVPRPSTTSTSSTSSTAPQLPKLLRLSNSRIRCTTPTAATSSSTATTNKWPRIHIDTTTTYCPFVKSVHQGNHQYLVVDVERMRVTVHCYCPRCSENYRTLALPHELEADLCAAIGKQPENNNEKPPTPIAPIAIPKPVVFALTEDRHCFRCLALPHEAKAAAIKLHAYNKQVSRQRLRKQQFAIDSSSSDSDDDDDDDDSKDNLDISMGGDLY